MIRHVVLFKLKPGLTWDSPEVRAAEELQERLGDEVADVREWICGRNISARPMAYDYAVVGLLDDEEGLSRYLTHPYHREVAVSWTAISDRVVVDLLDDHA